LRRLAAPLLRAALRDVARHDAFAREHLVGQVLQQALLELLVRIGEARHGFAVRRHLRARLFNLLAGRARFRLGQELTFLGEVALEQLRLLVVRQERINDPVDLFGLRPGAFQRVFERAPREPVLQLHPREPLFRGGVRNDAVLHDGDRRVLVQR
jgi:hypothetical protein